MTLIADTAALAAYRESLRGEAFVTVDTEFMRERTYFPRLCLVQVAGPKDAVAIDALAEGLDLSPLFDLMDDPTVIKVFHAARQDIEIFFNLTGRVPAPLFDTQVAAMVCGFGDQVGYDQLARKLTGAKIDKTSRFTDWSQRPLTPRQIDYALSDVVPLRAVYEKLAKRLDRTGRADWVAEEVATLTDPDTYRADPEDAWRRLKTRGGNRRFLGRLKLLAAWRERGARERNIPRNHILRDDSLLDLAAHAPKTPDALEKARGVGKGFAQGKMGRQLLEVMREAEEIPEDSLPTPPEKPELPSGLGPLTDLLRVLLKLKCEEHDVAQKLVASAADLELIAAGEETRALTGWRHEVFGADALALLRGEIAMTASGKEIRLVESGPA